MLCLKASILDQTKKRHPSYRSIHLRLHLFYMLFSSPFHFLILSEPKSHPNLFSQTLTSGSPNSYPKNYPTVAYPTKHPHIPDILSVLSVLPWRSCPSKWAQRRWTPHGAPEFGTIQSKKKTLKNGTDNGNGIQQWLTSLISGRHSATNGSIGTPEISEM